MFSSGHRSRRVTLAAELLDDILSQTSLGAEDRESLVEQVLLEAIGSQQAPSPSSRSRRPRRSSIHAPAYDPEEPGAEERSIPYDPNDWQPLSFGAWRSHRASSSNSSRSALRYSPTTPPSSVWSRSERFSQPYDPSSPLLPHTGVSNGMRDLNLYTPVTFQSRSPSVLPGGERSRVSSVSDIDYQSDSDELFVTQADMHACMDTLFQEIETVQHRLEQAFYNHLEQLWNRLESLMENTAAASSVRDLGSRERTALSSTDERKARKPSPASRKRKASTEKTVSFGSPVMVSEAPPQKRRKVSPDVPAKREQRSQGRSLRRSARLRAG